MRNPIHAGMGAIALVAVLGVTAPAAAQAGGDAYDSARANELHKQAREMYDNTDNWKKVASLHEKAAALRPPDDPQLLTDLQIAASIAAHESDFRRAERLMKELSDAAIAVGDVERAAHGYLTAALMAIKSGENRNARDYVERARLLTHSPLLSEEACDCIRSRLQQATGIEVAATP